jgi:hypothetical protein
VILPGFYIINIFLFPCAASLPCATLSSISVENSIINAFLLSLKRAIRKCGFKEERPKQRLPRTAPESVLIRYIRPYLIAAVNVVHFIVILSGNSRNRDYLEAITIEDLLQAL